MQENKSFINLLRKYNLDRIDIDPRLVDSFKRVMIKIQSYFNANGYTSQRNYDEFFEEYLLADSPGKLQLYINNEPSKIGAVGLYRHPNDETNLILVDEYELSQSNESLDAVLCHEFIHFLVMRGLSKENFVDSEIKNGGFINEALTEMLTQQIYPNSRSYEPQVNMMKFANLLTGNVNNYSQFLKGIIDSKGGASSWTNFVDYVSQYHQKMRNKGFIMNQAMVDELYIKAQQYIIQANVQPYLIANFQQYEEWISILQKRPAPDEEWIKKFIHQMNHGLISNLNLKDTDLKELLNKYLDEYNNTSDELFKYDGKDVIEFDIAGHKVAIDKDRHIYGIKSGYTFQWSQNNSICKFTLENETYEFDMNVVDFKKRRIELYEKQREISKYFSSNLKQDINAIKSVNDKENLLKLERFELPNVGATAKNSPIYIYVATYSDRIEVLNSPLPLGNMQNINYDEYVGITSKQNGAIYFHHLGQIQSGFTFSVLNQKQIQLKSIHLLFNQYKKSLKEEQILLLIDKYRKSEEYDIEDEKNINRLKDYAIRHYAETVFLTLSEEQKKEIAEEVINEQQKFIISKTNDELDISILFGNENLTAFKGKSVVLVDSTHKGLFNECLKKLPNIQYKNETSVLSFEEMTRDYQREEVKNMEEKSYDEQLQILTTELSKLNEKYGYVTSRMENLMKNNSIFHKQDFDFQIQLLTDERDKIQEEITIKNSSKKTLESFVNSSIEVKRFAIINELNRTLGIQISDIAGYIVDVNIPREIPKTVQQLENEKRNFAQKIDQIYFDGLIDIKKHNELKSNLIDVYNEMIEKAPNDIKNNATTSTPTSPPQAIPTKEIARENLGYNIERGHIAPEQNPDQRNNNQVGNVRKEKKELTKVKEEILPPTFDIDSEKFKEQYDEYGINLDDILREQQLIEQSRQTIEQSEEIGRRIR